MNLTKLINIASFEPLRIQPPNSWCGHLHFAACLIQNLNPEIFVELGSHSGNSYLSFCQSVKQFGLETKCYSVDTWQGDEQAGFYGEEIFTSLDDYNTLHYSGFSRLLRMTFDEAVLLFEDKSIELLHIDGLHSYEAVSHDFLTWLPKLAPGAIVLFHDTNVYTQGFGVWKFWSELKECYPLNFEFFHSHGLGVIQIDNGFNSDQLDWLEPSSTQKEFLQRYFTSIGIHQAKRYELDALCEQHKLQITSLSQAVANSNGEIDSLNQTVANRNGEIDSLNQTVANRNGEIDSLNQTVANRNGEIDSLNQTVADRGRQIEIIKRLLSERDLELASTNYRLRRLQAPLLMAKRFFNSILHPLKSFYLARDIRTVRTSQLFDTGYYLSQYRDVRIGICDAIRHYCEFGWKERRNPSPVFDTNLYLLCNPDVAKFGINPFVHYILHGQHEGRIGIQEIEETAFSENKNLVIEDPIGIQEIEETAISENKNLVIEDPIGIQEIEETAVSKIKILVMDYRIPRPDISAGEQATFGLLTNLCEFGFDVVFLPNDMLSNPNYEDSLKQLGVNVITHSQGYYSPSDYIRKHGKSFPLFYLIRVEVAEIVLHVIRQVAQKSRIIFHAPDIYFIREGRQAEIRNAPSLLADVEVTKQRELAVIGQVNHTFVVSPAELTILRQYLLDAPISVFKVLHASINSNPAPYNSRRDIFFLGGFTHTPNVDAVCWFVSEIWPIIHKELPDVLFHIVGSEAPKEILDFETAPGIVVDGYVKDLEPILSSMRIGVAPLRFGAGIKGKVATTMGAGIPMVCTGIAAEGMSIMDGIHARVADDNISFATAVVQIYLNQGQWKILSDNGRELVRCHFSTEANRSSFLSVLNEAEALPIGLFTEYCNSSPPIPLNFPADREITVDISVIIPVYNQWAYTQACLNSISATCQSGDIRYEIILADDGSTDETISAVKHFPGLQVVSTPQNLGFLRNCNHAAKYAKGKYILFLNNDTVVLPSWMSTLYQLMESDDSAAIIGSKLLYPDETIQEAGAVLWNDGSACNCGRYLSRNSSSYAWVREVDYVSGASFLVRKSFWESVGGFDERYENAYCEDSDLAMTARANGMRVLYQPKSEVIHFEHKSYTGERSDYLLPVQRTNIQRLRDKWRDKFASAHLSPGTPEYRGIANAERSASQKTLARRCLGSLNILYFSPFPSHPSNHGNQATIQQFGRRFQSMGYKVHFALLQSHLFSDDVINDMRACWDTLDILPNSHPLGANGEAIPFDGWYEEGLGERIHGLCAKYEIDVVFCTYVFQSKLLEFVPSHALKVIDTHDKMGNRYEMLRANGQPLEFFSCTPEEEGAYLRRADVVVARRDEEARYFDSVTGRATAIVIPHVEAPHFVEKNLTGLYKVGMVASANRINLTIVRECLEAINRRLHGGACPFTIHVAGQVKDIVDNLPPLEAEIFHKPWVLMHGFIPDIAQFYGDMDLVISPVTMGTGINVKTVQAMAFGMPLLTTAWGAKGIESEDPMHLHPDLNALADSLLSLKNHPEELERLAEVSRTRYASFYEESLAAMRGMFAHPKLWRKKEGFAPSFNPMFMTHSTYIISQDIRNQRLLVESEVECNSAISNGTPIEQALNAYCYVCGPAKMTFSKKYGWKDEATGQDVINWRENLVCPYCGLNNRMRAIVHILDQYCSINKTASVYITEQTTNLFSFLRSSLFPSLIGSEFLGNICPLGQIHNGIRNEDMICLTFADNSLAAVLSFDVLEHIPDFIKAFSEVYRCLASGGEFIFSVPFNMSSEKTLIRAEMNAEGNIHHILPPEYHGDPLDPDKGILCFQTFGWDLLNLLQNIGFEDVKALDYWSKEYGYLGESLLFMARKSSKSVDRQIKPIKRDDPGLRNYLIQALERYYLEGQHTDDVIISAENLIRMDGEGASTWLPEVLSRNQMHDEDFSIFRAFNSANWGYSAASIWTVCPQANIVAFEPILSYENGLQKIKELRPGCYDYRMIGLANETTLLKFAVPVVNGIAISALSSASILVSKAHIAILARNIHDVIIHWMPDENLISLRIFEFESPVRKLDDVLQEENFLLEKKLSAIKIDVEGYEFEVLKDAEETLRTYKPLIMAEGGNRFDGLPDFMEALGYLYAEKKGESLVLVEGLGTSINGFFVHKDNLSEYKSSGILDMN